MLLRLFPEEDVILVHAEDDIRDLVPLETVLNFIQIQANT